MGGIPSNELLGYFHAVRFTDSDNLFTPFPLGSLPFALRPLPPSLPAQTSSYLRPSVRL